MNTQNENEDTRCPYCEERARMSVQYHVEVGPCPLHAPKEGGS